MIAPRERACGRTRKGERERHADDRLHTRLGKRFGEFKRTEETIGIGQSQRGRAIGARYRR